MERDDIPVSRSNNIALQLDDSEEGLEVFICPITQEIMQDPVIVADGTCQNCFYLFSVHFLIIIAGHSYERAAICAWFRQGKVAVNLKI